MTSTFVILGAGGDVTSRFVVPGLIELHERGRLPDGLRIVATGRQDRSDQEFRDELREVACDEGCDGPAADSVIGRLEWVEADATDHAALSALPVGDVGPVHLYLALPPSVFADTIAAVSAATWSDRARLAIEKPFGTDRRAAMELNSLLGEHFDATRVFRVDHFLGLESTRRLRHLVGRRLLAAALGAPTVRSIEVVWDETLALEGRAGYYDDTGALVDMIQNHLLQVLAVALTGPDGEPVPAGRLAALRQLRVRAERAARARYAAGEIDGTPIPAYIEEEGVDPAKRTETFATVELTSGDPRWGGVAMTVRSGKALPRDRHELRIEMVDGDEVVVDLLTAETTVHIDDLELRGGGRSSGTGPYAQMLADLFDGDPTWFVSAEEAEEQWRIVEPVLAAWARDDSPLPEHPAGEEPPSA